MPRPWEIRAQRPVEFVDAVLGLATYKPGMGAGDDDEDPPAVDD